MHTIPSSDVDELLLTCTTSVTYRHVLRRLSRQALTVEILQNLL